METPIDEIIAQTLKKLDETEEILDDAVEFGEPDFDLRTLIRALIEESATEILREVPLRETGEWEQFGGTAHPEGGRMMVRLPDDFLRLIYIRMEGWERPVFGSVDPDSDIAGLLRFWSRRPGNAYARARPGVAVGPYGSASGQGAEVFGCASGAAVAAGAYLPLPRITGDMLRFPPSLMPRLTDRLASKIKRQ